MSIFVEQVFSVLVAKLFLVYFGSRRVFVSLFWVSQGFCQLILISQGFSKRILDLAGFLVAYFGSSQGFW